MKKKIIIPSLVTIVLCLSLIVGSTFALFSEEINIDVTITSGNVDIEVELDALKTSSMGKDMENGNFELGGKATLTDDYNIEIVGMVPGDAVSVNINVANNSNVPISYCVRMVGDGKLIEALEASVEIDGVKSTITADENMSEWINIGANEPIGTIPVTIFFPGADNNNDYKNLENNSIRLQVVAVQGNGADMYEAVDTFWYDESKDTLEISTAADLVGFAKLVNSGTSFADKTVVLTADINLENMEWTPIGTSSSPFRGVFDGNGKTIENFTVNTEAGAGLFGYINANTDYTQEATVKNLTVKNVTIVAEDYAGAIAGHIYGNINGCAVESANITCGAKAGSIVGFVMNESGVESVISDNSAKDVEIIADRDAGAIAGFAVNETAKLSGNSFNNVTVTWSNEGTGENISNEEVGRTS